MPTVPREQRRVAPTPVGTPFQSSNVPAGAFGGQIGQSLSNIGNAGVGAAGTLLDIATQEQIEDNERETKRLDVEFAQEVRRLTYGDDQTPGYYAQRGENAIAGQAPTVEALNAARQRLLEGVTSERVREMFSDISTNRVERELTTISRHVTRERRVANDATSEARLGEALDDAGANWGNSSVINQSIGMVRSEVSEMAERNGWSAEVASAKAEEAESALHRAVIDAAVDRNPGYAVAYFNANKDNIDGRLHSDIEKVLEVSSVRASGQASADEILALNLPERDALARAREISNPKLRDEVVTRVSQRYSEEARIEQREDRATLDAAWGTLTQGGSIDDLSAQQLSAINGTTLNSMRAFENRRAEDGRGYAVVTEPDAYNELHNLYMDDKLAFSELDLNSMLGRLDESDYQYWSTQQRAIDRNSERQASYVLADRMAKEYLNSAGIEYTSSASKTNAAKAQTVFGLIRGVVDGAHEEGRTAERDDIDRALKELFLQGEVDGSGFVYDTNQAYFNVVGTPDEAGFILNDAEGQAQALSDITGAPIEMIPEIVQALEARSIPVTAANIEALYNEATGGR